MCDYQEYLIDNFGEERERERAREREREMERESISNITTKRIQKAGTRNQYRKTNCLVSKK